MRLHGESTGYHMYLRRLSAQRRRNAVALLDAFSKLLGSRDTFAGIDWASVPECDYSGAVQYVHQTFPTRTINVTRSHIQAVLREEHLMGRLTLQQLDTLRRPWEEAANGKRPRKCGADHTAWDLGSLLETCERDATPWGARDGALISLIWTLQLGPSELVKVAVGKEFGQFTRGGSDPRLQQALHRWLDLRGHSPGPLLLSTHRQGRIRPVPMTQASVSAAIKRRGRQAGFGGLTASSLIAAAALSSQSAG